MAFIKKEESRICRFCLNQDEEFLIPIEKLLDTSLTMEDVQRFTGIEINTEANIIYTMCLECTNSLKISAAFRTSCLNNDTLFHVLSNVQAASIDQGYDDSVEDDKTNRLPYTLLPPKKRGRNPRYDPLPINWSNGQQANKRKEKQVLDLSTARNNPNFFVKKYKNELRVYPKTLCEVCGIFVVGIGQHLVNHRPGLMHKCPYCMVKMKKKTNITAHINTVHFKMVGKTCGICGKGFVHQKTYRHHMLTHEGKEKNVRAPRSGSQQWK